MDFHGKFGWNELMTPDVEKAKTFYADMLGWTYTPMPLPEGDSYWVAYNKDQPNGGIMDMKGRCPPGTPAFWFSYIMVESVDKSLKQVVAGGGKIIRPAWDVPEVGRIAVCEDATGAGFALMTPVMPAS